jgi:hypothetical protein
MRLAALTQTMSTRSGLPKASAAILRTTSISIPTGRPPRSMKPSGG